MTERLDKSALVCTRLTTAQCRLAFTLQRAFVAEAAGELSPVEGYAALTGIPYQDDKLMAEKDEVRRNLARLTKALPDPPCLICPRRVE